MKMYSSRMDNPIRGKNKNRWKRMKKIFTGCCILIFIALMLGCRNTGCGRAAAAPADLGQIIGDVSLKTADGKSITLSKLDGVYVVAFWVPGSMDSKYQLDDLALILRTTKFKGVKAIAITRGKDDDEQKNAAAVFGANKWPFTLVYDTNLDASNMFAVKPPLPAFYVIGADHKLKAINIRRLFGNVRNQSFMTMLSTGMSGGTVSRIECLAADVEENPNRALIGSAPPPFSVTDMRGRTFSPLQFKGVKNLVIIFWNPGCPHCHRELPRLKEFINRYGQNYGVEVLAITIGSGAEFRGEVETAVNDMLIDFPVAIAESAAMKPYGASKVPLAYVINKNGIVCEAMSGEHDDAMLVYKSIFDDPGRMQMK